MPLYFRYKNIKFKMKEISSTTVKHWLSEKAPDNPIKMIANEYGHQTFEELSDERKEYLFARGQVCCRNLICNMYSI